MSLGGILQYQTNTASNTQTLGSVKETIAAKPVAQAQELMPGKVFEGMVTDIKNGQVTLGLSDGRTISARMEAGVSLEKGQPMLFEVKANTGDQISIRPVTLESAQNPTLMKALEAAGLKVTPRNLSMVNEMMMEQLPIDKSSLMQMARAAASFPEANMQTLVQMQKLGIAITENSLNQFQNYQNGQQAVLPQMQELMEGIRLFLRILHWEIRRRKAARVRKQDSYWDCSVSFCPFFWAARKPGIGTASRQLPARDRECRMKRLPRPSQRSGNPGREP